MMAGPGLAAIVLQLLVTPSLRNSHLPAKQCTSICGVRPVHEVLKCEGDSAIHMSAART